MLTKIDNNTFTFTSRKSSGQTFSEFSAYAQRTDFRSKVYGIISNNDNYISEGAFGRVYSIPDNDGFVLKVNKEVEIDTFPDIAPKISEVHDPFGSLNVGQPVAKYGDDILVLIRQKGKEHGISFSEKSNINPKNIEQYLKNISMMSEVSQQGYNNFALEVKQLKKLGFNLDIWNANNILVNGDEINLVDIVKLRSIRDKFYSRISKTALVRLLIDEAYLRDILPHLSTEQKSSLGKDVKIIFDKVGIAMKNANLSQLNVVNKILASIRDIAPRSQQRIDVIINELIKYAR